MKEKIGVSVYDPDEAIAALRDPDVKHLQVHRSPLKISRWNAFLFAVAYRFKKNAKGPIQFA